MPRLGPIIAFTLLIIFVAGIILSAIGRLRSTSDRVVGMEHLRVLGSQAVFQSTRPGDQLGKDTSKFFPAGTVLPSDLPPDQRLSWLSTVLGGLTSSSTGPGGKGKPMRAAWLDWPRELEPMLAWNLGQNRTVAQRKVSYFLAPSNPAIEGVDGFAVTQYLGNGGIGQNTPTQSLDEAGDRAGVFRYDTPTRRAGVSDTGDILDGLSTTIAIGEARGRLGPWLQGGPATIRTVEVDETPLFGTNAPYGGCLPDGALFSFADGSARFIQAQIRPDIFRAQLTIRGNESFE